ncbi:hypothetical protein [Pseudoduganella namucuonensis]|uniref:hypothetical protein n=1 Tax=Pseudoduganella namucuonensis TaxID=1035707 RepID=UPI0011607DC8|nr:hypothetical protein [Pseudoduganella namucuonensis]
MGEQVVDWMRALERADWIALGALGVSVVSALYSSRSWREDRKANGLTVLVKQQEIYDGFCALHNYMVMVGRSASMEEVRKFYYFKGIARVYLPDSIAKDIEKYFDACFELADAYSATRPSLPAREQRVDEAAEVEEDIGKTLGERLITVLRESSSYRAPWYERCGKFLTRLV